LEAFPENSLNLKSKASHKCASKIFPGTLLNCLQKILGTLPKLPPKLSWHFAKSATKNYTSTSPNASSKTLLALLKTARNNFSLPHLMWHFFILPLKGFTGSLVAFAGTLKCLQFRYLT
jgi:hypothetical protein